MNSAEQTFLEPLSRGGHSCWLAACNTEPPWAFLGRTLCYQGLINHLTVTALFVGINTTH